LIENLTQITQITGILLKKAEKGCVNLENGAEMYSSTASEEKK